MSTEVDCGDDPISTVEAGVVPDADGLATTGVDLTAPILVGGSLLVAGSVLLLLAARRRTKLDAGLE